MKKHVKPIITVLLVMVLLIPTVAMLVTNAAETTYVELAFSNVFVFEKWANNSLSSTVIADGIPKVGGTLETDIVNGSFTLTKTDMNKDELYTAFSMNSEDAAANEDYYMMDVEPNTSYTFTYNVSGDIYVFTPYVFMYTDEGLYNSNVPYGTPGYGVNSFSFTTPANVKYIQVRFTIGDDINEGNKAQSSVYATVKDIAIYKTELYDAYLETLNMFSFEDWAANPYSSATPTSNLGTVTLDAAAGKIKMENTGTGYHWTGFGIDTAASNDQYYTMDVQSNTSYVLTYDIVEQNLLSPIYMQPFIVEMDSSGKCITYYSNPTAAYTGNQFSFTTKANTARIQLVFALITDGDNLTGTTEYPSRYCTIENIGIYEPHVPNTQFDFETVTGHTHRETYEVSTGTYDTLPEPTNVPAGMVFAGWYTAPDGSGERITKDTDVSYQSYAVYPKYEIKVDAIEVVTPPTKTTYTLGEKFNPAGLVLKATAKDADGNTTTVNINSGYYCTPEYLTATGEQTITVNYGGETATLTVTVNASENKSVTINDVVYDNIAVANNKYTLDYSTTPFNRYELTYYSDSYVRGIITLDGDTEEFFLEPSNNGHFASYIDAFLRGVSHYSVVSIEFTCLNKEFGKFELLSLSTISAPIPSSTVQYYENEKYKVGIDLAFGGVISYIECLEGSTATDNNVVAAQYTDANGKVYTKVDYKDKLPAGAIATVESVNLINTNDRGRYLQQSYYGTDQPPFVMGDYNGVPWNYNPVQGGNLQSTITGNGGEASKVIDYRITDNQIYVKTRPLDWGKNSTDYADDPAWNTPSYMEAWYTFTTDGKGLIQGTCRFVDYSGYPSNTTTQEFPALYTVEPLNHFVYNNVEEGAAWDATQTEFKNDAYLNTVADTQTIGTGAINIEEPEFWGVLPSYVEHAPNKDEIDPNVVANEHWAAFTASEDKDSFGIGIYSPGVTDIHYGCFVAKYEENQYKRAGENGAKVDGGYIKALDAGTADSYDHIENFRHAETLDPAVELHTSYIAPIETLTFDSYTPITYTYYVSTGTADEIREDFRRAKENEENAEKEITKIAVPETVYMTPVAADDTHTTVGQYYVNNILNDFNVVETVAESADKMYVGLYALDAKTFTVKVTNATNPSDDIEFYNLSTNASAEGQTVTYPADGTYRADNTYGLRFKSTGLKHGEMATAKWEITVTLEDNSTETYTAYTVLYAPERTVGAVAESRRRGVDNNETGTWITGATSMVVNSDGSHQLTPIGGYVLGDPSKSGYFKQDPLVYPENMTTESTDQTADDHINVTSDATAYVMQSAVQSDDHSRAKSYLGLLTIDQSRYSNTNQIPNFKIGYDVLHVHDGRNDSLKDYKTSYTLGTAESFNPSGSGDANIQAAPSGWSTEGLVGNGRIQNWKDSPYSTPYRQTVAPDYAVSSDMDGKYIHTFSQALANYLGDRTYGTSVASVMIKVTDKSELRDSVLDGYHVTDGTPLFEEKLQNAATILGDPTSTQEEIDNANKELSDASKFALKYDNLFSALEFSQHSSNMKMSVANSSVSYSNGTIIVKNNTITAGEAYTNYASSADYYLIDVKPNTEYVFEYDVTTTIESQAFLFSYNANGGNSEAPTNITVQTDGGAWTSKTEGNSWIGNYQETAGDKHYAIKFTTGSTTTRVGFRFGNTSNSPTESTFSNIRLIDSARYYEGATYSKTEASYAKDASYGSLITPVRPGYTFVEWVDAAGNTVSGSNVATSHTSVFSVWTEHSYTIVYNANGGSGTIAGQTAVKYSQNVTLASTGFTRTDYALVGWSTDKNATTVQYQLGQTVSKLSDVNGATITLYAVWEAPMNITFDNIVDMMAWQNSAEFKNKASSIADITETGFTVVDPANGGETTVGSPSFAVTAGKQYKIDIDITGDSWDVYIFFRDSSGKWLHSDGPDSRYSSDVFDGMHEDHVFTAPADAVRADIRVDSNQTGAEHKVNFENIRVYEYDGISPIEVTTSNAYIPAGSKFGTLPTPTKEGFEFLGWYDESGNQVTADSIVPDEADKLVPLTSKWKLANTALTEDTFVLDFGSPMVSTTVLSSDTIFNKAAAAYKATASIIGLSADGGATYGNTVQGRYGTFKLENGNVTYTPSTVINGIDEIFYHAQLSAVDTTVVSNSIKVVPASNVLYEEQVFKADSKEGAADWEPLGEAETETQSASTSTDVYGYDESYNEVSDDYSNGSSIKATVNSTTKRSETQKVVVKGTGFDIIGSCGDKTGVLIVNVKDSAGNIARVFIVDTYYKDTSMLSSGGNLNQIPVVSFNDDYDTYTVEVTSAYLASSNALKQQKAVESYALDGTEIEATSTVLTNDELIDAMLMEIGMEELVNEEIELVWMDENSIFNGGTGAEGNADSEVSMYSSDIELYNYIDAIRVYNPIDNDGYYIESEQDAEYYNILNNLADTENGIFTSGDKMFAYIEGSISGSANFSDYISKGPQNELYLSNYIADDKSSGIAFKVNLPDDAKVMLGVRAVTGSPKLTVNGQSIKQLSDKRMHTTEMYYDITNLITVTDGVATVAITNTGDGLLAVNNLKLVGATTAAVDEFSLEETVALMSLRPVDVEFDGPSVAMSAETDDTVDEGTENEETPNFFDQLIEKIRSFFSDIFGFIKWFFEYVISMFTTKEVV